MHTFKVDNVSPDMEPNVSQWLARIFPKTAEQYKARVIGDASKVEQFSKRPSGFISTHPNAFFDVGGTSES